MTLTTLRAIALAVSASAILAQPAFAGGMAEPIMEPEVVVEDTGTSGGILIPLLLLVLIAAAVASSSDGGSTS